MDFFYDKQIRRLILQTFRMFGGIKVVTGLGSDGQQQFRTVPIRWGQPDRMTQQILRLNSENKILPTPLMSSYITSISMAPDRRQNPSLVSTKLVDERQYDEATGQYTGEMGDRYTVKRYMPVPYNFTFQLDIWTSNQDQKMQILEQIMMLFNPSIDLQTSDNPLDWTAITFAEMQDPITLTSRSIPLGTEEQIDVASLTFLVPYWINPPTEVTRRKAIEIIITNINAVNELPIDDTDFSWEQGELLTQVFITPDNRSIIVEGTEIILAGCDCSIVDDDNNIFNWKTYLNQFADFTPGESVLIVKRKFGDPTGISGTVDYNTTDVNKLVWTIDNSTLPVDTLAPFDAIIDPQENGPGDGLPSAVLGQRYLLANDISEVSLLWGTVADGKTNDIIEFDGLDWVVSFDSEAATDVQIATNNFSGQQLRFNPDENGWELAVDGCYKPGTWKISAMPPVNTECE